MVGWWAAWIGLALAGARVEIDAAGIEIAQAPTGALDEARTLLESERYVEAARALGALADAGDDPGVRALAVLAAYEAGDLRDADAHASRGLARAPFNGPLRVLQAMVRADQGDGDGARDALVGAPIADPRWAARAARVLATIAWDEGRAVEAVAQMQAAAEAAVAAGLGDEVQAAREAVARWQARRDEDVVGRVSDALSRGDAAGAARAVSVGEGSGVRLEVQAAIAGAMVRRVAGDLPDARRLLGGALRDAARAGLVRESLVARLELARVQTLSGDDAAAIAALREAWASVRKTSLRVRAFDVGAALALRLAWTGAVGEAVAVRDAVVALAGSLDDPRVVPRRDEVIGVVEARSGRATEGLKALARAVEGWRATGRVAEAGRVALEHHRVATAVAAAPLSGLDAVLASAGLASPAGARRVAEGLGHADAGRLAEAVRAFEDGATRATTAGDAVLAARARAWADEAGRALGLGAGDAAARLAAAQAARAQWEAGRTAMASGDHDAALAAFSEAALGFARAGEEAPARQAREAALRSRFNQAVAGGPSAAAGLDAVRDAARADGFGALAARAEAAAAVAQAIAGAPDAARLEEAAREALLHGLDRPAGLCHAERARLGPPAAAEAAARDAVRLLGEPGAPALVDAAFVAWRADDTARAADLVEAARGRVDGAAARDLASLHEALEAVDPPRQSD